MTDGQPVQPPAPAAPPAEPGHNLKGPFEATVLFNKTLRKCFCRMGLQFTGAGAEAFAKTRPGQFAQFDLSHISLPAPETIPDDLKDDASRQILLRRPFSFARVAKEVIPPAHSGAGPASHSAAHPSTHIGAGKIIVEVVYCVLGPATLRMTTLVKGNTINIIGPLGNGFTVPAGKKRAILVAGGMGSPPLEHLAQVLTAEHPTLDAIAFAGAKTKDDLSFERPLDNLSQEIGFWLGEFARYSISSFVATDDGSAGFKGFVSNCITDWLSQNSITLNPAETIIYACGPRSMLATIAKLARDKKIDCQISMEEMMACGIGLCQSCAVKCVAPGGVPAGDKGEKYKLCCKDGPVFDAKEIVF
ncbi:MAG: dihydroorotate dehydrogenase electron transfer subunit [Sedimentisphaerales bacterium]